MCFRASVLLRKASALKRIDVRYGPQNAGRSCTHNLKGFT